MDVQTPGASRPHTQPPGQVALAGLVLAAVWLWNAPNE